MIPKGVGALDTAGLKGVQLRWEPAAHGVFECGERMTLRLAIEALPDDRTMRSAVRHVLAYLRAHEGESLEVSRISIATGVSRQVVEDVMTTFSRYFVVDCGGSNGPCVYRPSSSLSVEVQRYLRTADLPDARLRKGAERFRNRLGGGPL